MTQLSVEREEVLWSLSTASPRTSAHRPMQAWDLLRLIVPTDKSFHRGDVTASNSKGGIYPQASKIVWPELDQAIEKDVEFEMIGSEEDHGRSLDTSGWSVVCTENLIRVDDVMESLKLVE
jgi:hypothetical protein